MSEKLDEFSGKIISVFLSMKTIDVKNSGKIKSFYLQKKDPNLEMGKTINLTYNPDNLKVRDYSLSQSTSP